MVERIRCRVMISVRLSAKSLWIFPDFGYEGLKGFDDIEFYFFRETLG